MSRERLTPIYEDAPAPRRPRAHPPRFRIAKMGLPELVLVYGALCGYRLAGANLTEAGLDLTQWKIWRLEFGDAARQASLLTFILLSIELALRIGRKSGKARK